MILQRVIILLVLSLSILHNTQRRFEINDLFDLKLIKGIQLYPDDKKILLQISEVNESLDKRVNHLWETDFEGNLTKLTNYPNGELNPQFYDKDKVSFLALNNGKQNIYIYDIKSKSSKLMFPHNKNVVSFLFSKNKDIIYFLSSEKGKIKNTEINIFSNADSIYPNNILMSYNLTTGEKETLTIDTINVKSISLSPDGNNLALTIAPSSYPDDEIFTEIYLLNLSTKKIVKLTNNRIIERSISWSSDGERLYFLSDANRNLEMYYQYNLFYYNILNGKIEILTDNFDYEVNSYYLGKNNDIYCLANMGVTQNLFKYDFKESTWKQITKLNALIRYFYYDYYRDIMLSSISTPQQTDEVYLMNKKGDTLKQITILNPQLKSFLLSKVEVIGWESSDKKIVEGILYYPVDYNPQKKYPLIVVLHGGPASSYQLQFPSDYNNYAHILTGRGYFIFQPNYRGSTGYGDEWMRGIVGHYFELDVDDIITGIKHLAILGLIDSNKVALQGWSAGAHLTNWLITHFSFFKAASSFAGISDWVSLYRSTEIKYLRKIWFQGSPEEKYEDYFIKSPIHYVKNVRTPTLLFSGETDRRIPLEQVKNFYYALKKVGCETKFISFPDNGHGLWQVSKQKTKMKEEIEWFLKYVN